MPPVSKKIKVFDSFPPASKDTFDQGALLLSEKPDEQLSLILYGQDLQNIAYIDNRTSDATAKYDKSVTVGFSFTTTQSISTEVAAEFSIEFVKASFKLTLTLTFSQQWSRAVTDTHSVEVPAGKEAYLYQGYVRSRILRHSTADDTYSWIGTTGTLYTPAYVTRNKPIT
ncbi:hypothetical protein AB0C76_39745 [Kitasatospora sp. NPDC048722]|uniref:hypothetical protein n=1 Tax=Kitasatospora sp. NPDC048722 TaxID=3155639 RepID=UPI0033D74FB5